MPILGDNHFDLQSLCAAINILPTKVGKINRAGLFPIKGKTTRVVMIDEREGSIVVLPSKTVGAPATLASHETRRARTFNIPHFPLDDVLLPEDVQGIRAFGSETQAEVMTQRVNERLQALKDNHDATLEYLRMGALKGEIKDGSLNTVVNLFTEYGISQQTFTFTFSSATTDIKSTCRNVVRYIRQNLKGEVMTSVKAYVAADFFDALTNHDSVKETWLNWQAAAELRGYNPENAVFEFGGIQFVEYSDSVTLADGTSGQLIADDTGHAFPDGTIDMYATYCAPADFNETVNTPGLEYYAKISERKHGRGYDLHTQSNPLPLCHRPACLVKLVAA